METCLITGGAGFIGSHLCERLLSDGFRVICMDNVITGSVKNLEGAKKDKDFVFVKRDVTKHISIGGKLDYVLHFASIASPVDYVEYPIQTLKVGTLGTHNALGLAKSKGAAFMFASTSEVYGDPEVNPQPETYWGNVNPVGIRSCYDESKRCGEALTMAYHRKHGLDTKIVRIFNTYGPRMRKNDGRVVPAFINQALEGRPLTVFGDGSQTRSFCYVSDLIEGIRKLMDSGVNDPVNLGNPDETTIMDFAKKVIRLTKSASGIEYNPLPENDPVTRCPDITVARKALGWKPRVGLDGGLLRTIDFFRGGKR
ncbi:MAG: UDP-glucuronic acid decarboxylase family protein [Candidatus Aenigmatarchaeota archaeon]